MNKSIELYLVNGKLNMTIDKATTGKAKITYQFVPDPVKEEIFFVLTKNEQSFDNIMKAYADIFLGVKTSNYEIYDPELPEFRKKYFAYYFSFLQKIKRMLINTFNNRKNK